MQISAHLQSLRIAPRKVRLVTDLIKGSDAVAARHRLAYLPKRSSLPIAKLLDSALANAENNLGLLTTNMKIKDVKVNGGSVLKRFRPKGFGSASPIARRTSHVTIILEEKVPGLKSPTKAKKEEKVHTHSEEHEPKPEVKKEIGTKESTAKKFTKRIFQRKSV